MNPKGQYHCPDWEVVCPFFIKEVTTLKEHTYIKIRIDFKKPMTQQEIEELVAEMDHEINDDEGRIDSTEFIETTDF
ncbi:hypothetical protein KUL42_39230 [Alteromonas sp. KUL42]|uniref:hypothetical protein n=1 Tax=Alteromonas sp. KUL42 TaxID=2480797 RepID=UPI0010367C83|nr:hypothetical protein [Alteromonas sp. KUL42]TAP31728.1 hypothetical protein EYR97_19770 [Alteromonas sp. KUL42]GEA09162.1 hypothetical protein KUL42_39230 [Alteromonas sp. KUL42]